MNPFNLLLIPFIFSCKESKVVSSILSPDSIVLAQWFIEVFPGCIVLKLVKFQMSIIFYNLYLFPERFIIIVNYEDIKLFVASGRPLLPIRLEHILNQVAANVTAEGDKTIFVSNF